MPETAGSAADVGGQQVFGGGDGGVGHVGLLASGGRLRQEKARADGNVAGAPKETQAWPTS
jgi:hypothetical protein